ncbi:MAG: hypothetical protein A3F83_02290 [Candidatus Glassbacteria bacterium RIFCSPLOWO2_12_FULL_58_11]|uniref:PTS EIIA type-2 domain-containing protein n=2 Tax=Candidatus Glassiibacteriota TaxID=1817805 RepID=A0A1F5YM94_9BACT|nr:MAG: hypothetical protein A2Z86_04220 [Candidatus Glassbacteria bacterium GWA2_58_10]OGG01002.1 MAG: hypothetical protein A3F83_02290 [Candidatus Glassbacteria bacterium RIFCSPLOWO2_12_FULL_58_11]
MPGPGYNVSSRPGRFSDCIRERQRKAEAFSEPLDISYNCKSEYYRVIIRSWTTMELKELFNASNVNLDLEAQGKDEVLLELINLLHLDEKAKEMLFKMLKKRENLGSTGIGKGFAIPHCRSLVVDKLNVAFARQRQGIDFNSIDDKPAHYFFLIVAPPVEISNYYLPVLGKVAQFCKISDITSRLDKLTKVEDFLKLLADSGS